MARRETIVKSIEIVAETLEDRLSDFVLVGGAAAALLVNDPAAEDVRHTDDVDLVVEIVTYSEYSILCEQLRNRYGFVHDVDGPMCRFKLHGIKVDFLPVEEGVLDFTNSWYRQVVKQAQDYPLPSGRIVKLTSAPVFLCTKLEAFRDRGKGDFYASHDLEDIVSILDGRTGLVLECKSAEAEIQEYISRELESLLQGGFEEAIEGLLPYAAQSRTPLTKSKILELINRT